MKFNYSIARNTIYVLLISFVVIFYFLNILLWSVFILIGLIVVMIVIGVADIKRNFFVESINQVPTEKPHVAITFDDGPNDAFTSQVLDLLAEYNHKATFFCIGKNIAENSSMLKRIDTEGHTIGNHSYHHTYHFDISSTKKVKEELKKSGNEIRKVISKEPRLFRPPFGITNPRIAKAIDLLNMNVVGWNIRSFDTKNESEEKIFNRIKTIKAGDIVLLHDTSQRSVNVLKKLLQLLEEKGLKSVTIDQLAKIDAYA